MIVWAADKFALEPSAKVTTTDPSAWTWTSVAVGFAALTAATTFAFSSSVSADGSYTTVTSGAWMLSASLAFSVATTASSLEFWVVSTGFSAFSSAVAGATSTAGAA